MFRKSLFVITSLLVCSQAFASGHELQMIKRAVTQRFGSEVANDLRSVSNDDQSVYAEGPRYICQAHWSYGKFNIKNGRLVPALKLNDCVAK
jgi:hypothetical protein